MFKDLEQLSVDNVLKYDVCIIGSGPAGISVAKKLFKSDYKISILESGGIESEDDYQELNNGNNSGPSYLSLYSSRLRCFGGAGKLWAGHCAPFSSDDFEKKPFDKLSGWPISINDLEKYYIEAAKLLGISYEKFYDKNIFGKSFLENSFQEFKSKNNFLSTNVLQVSSAEHRDLAEKFRTHFKSSKNMDVIFHSTVTKINLEKNNKSVRSVSIADLKDNKAVLKAKIFVLACGALENPRILLSSNDQLKYGIGNSTGFVGSCFMSHPGIDNVAEMHKNNEECISKDENNKYKFYFEVSPKERLKQNILRHSISLKPSNDYQHSSKSFKFLKKCKIYLGGEFSPKNWDLAIGLEQPPRLSNSLKLSNIKDNLGIPTIDIYWDNLSVIEKETVIKSAETIARELGSHNTGKVKFKKALLNGESFKIDDPINHHIGTTRMSSSSKTGVVDKNCKVFGVSNLFIAGSSVFTTSSIVNPTYTIIALSLRLGDYIKTII